MVYFITFLRALAACLITNSHYTGIYPSDIIANGGLIGDIIFFAVSGYCLTGVRHSFPRWYGKRIVRCYLPVLLITAFYVILGAYSLADNSFFHWFVYPTNYHFVASIVLLYIPYYVVMKFDVLKKHIPTVMTVVAFVFVLVYVFFYDKSYYHIDTVREPMIRFLFFECMLLGGYFRLNDKKYRNEFKWWAAVGTVVLFVAYFASKLLFSKVAKLSGFQIVNQILIFALLYFGFRLVASLDAHLEKMPKWLTVIVTYIAEITLEIYVVQYVLIDILRPYFFFPINWIAITASILAAATVLHYAVKAILALCDVIINKIKMNCSNKETVKREEK